MLETSLPERKPKMLATNLKSMLPAKPVVRPFPSIYYVSSLDSARLFVAIFLLPQTLRRRKSQPACSIHAFFPPPFMHMVTLKFMHFLRYAFIEYLKNEDALKAIQGMHNKYFRGSNLVIGVIELCMSYDECHLTSFFVLFVCFSGPVKHLSLMRLFRSAKMPMF